MAIQYTITGAALKDEFGRDFMVATLPMEYIPDDAARREWQAHFRRTFQFPVVIAWVDQSKNEWTLRGQTGLLRLLKERNLDRLPWQRVLVDAEERPPISYDEPESPGDVKA